MKPNSNMKPSSTGMGGQVPLAGRKNRKNEQTFFNESFYQEKIPQLEKNSTGTTYASYEFVKKYFEATRMNALISKTVQTTLQSSALPENPYNMIGRLLLHEAISENTKVYYSLEASSKNRPNSGNQGAELGLNEPANHSNVMADIRFRAITLTAGWKIRNLIREDCLGLFWELLVGKVNPKEMTSSKKNSKPSRAKTMSISHCLGGSLLLKTGCPYSAEETIAPSELIFMQLSENMQHLGEFANHVIEDCMKICESPDTIFIRLKIESYAPMAMEWSVDNLVHNKSKIAKEIVKNCMLAASAVKAEYLIKLPLAGQKIVGTTHSRVSKTYILVEQDNKKSKIYSIRPATILLTSVFPAESQFFEAVLQNFSNKGTAEELIHELHNELHSYMIMGIEEQMQSWVGWSLFFTHLYEFKEKKARDQELWFAINYMINSPLNFIEELRHEFNVVKLISGRHSISHNEVEVYEILEKLNKKIAYQLQKEEYVYPEVVLFLEAAHRNLDLILSMQKGRQFSIRPIIQRIEIMMKYLSASFYQICFVLKGHLLNEIVRIDNEFGKEGSGETITKTVTYDILLRKYKSLPERNLNLNEQVKALRSTFNRPDQDIRELILAKYVKQYQLYEHIYNFYWTIVCGRKLTYPMSRLVNSLRSQAIKHDCSKLDEVEGAFQLEEHQADGIMIYQKAADSQGEHVYYALSASSLDDHKIRDYRTVFGVFGEYFQSDMVSRNSLNEFPNMQKCSYLLSVNANINRGKWEESDFNKCKVYVDVVYSLPLNKQESYRIIFEELKSRLKALEEVEFGIIGLYAGEPEHIDEDRVYPWTEQEQRFDIQFVRYYSKRPLDYESVVKLVMNCAKLNVEIIVRGVFWLNGFLKSCTLSFNFLINEEWLLNRSHTYEDRVFCRYDDVIRWGNYNGLKKYLASRKQIEASPQFNQAESAKELYLSNHIDMIHFVAEASEETINIKKVRNYSPFYSMLEQALSLAESLFFLLEFLKTDREGKFSIKDFQDTIELLEYYLFEKCLRSDRYIYSEGLSVSIINLVGRITRYIEDHPDNNGEEKELIYLQKITVRLMNCIQYALTSCAFGVIEAINSQREEEDGEDDSQEGSPS